MKEGDCYFEGILYELQISVDSPTANVCQAEASGLRHRRLGHLKEQAMTKFVQYSKVEGIISKPKPIGFYYPSVKGK